MANIKEYIKKVMDGTVSLEEQQAALAQVEKTIVEAKQRRDESVGQKADMVVQALKTIEAKLEAKLAELNNTPAMQGVQGPTGKAGKDGVDGKDGLNGVSGKDGKDGKDGVDGKDGISVVDAKIDFDGSLVVYLSNGAEIDCGQILSPDVAQNIIINSGGSGTSQSVTDTLASLQTQINTLTGIDGTLGTMAQQDANAVAITGGTINGTTIGATTPSTVNATTITGQTGVLKGTGSNLVFYSQDFTHTSWIKGQITATATGATAPDGTTTSIRLLETLTSATHNLSLSSVITSASGSNYTLSVYAKANGRNYVGLYEIYSGKGKFFNITAGGGGSVLGNLVAAPVSAALTYVGNDWYRISMVITASSSLNLALYLSTDGTTFNYTGNTSLGIQLWGAQVEIGSTLNTYIPTTTTAVYGTPTLSFSGVSTIGLESNGALFVQPAGTGALQAQATTSTTAGGNARGANAVDWQTNRSAAGGVASGFGAIIGGGTGNSASATYGNVLGGTQNSASGSYSLIAGGIGNTVTSSNANSFGFVGGGYANTSGGVFNFIGGGYTNSGTSASAVTTQSGTMNATTAVTLSGSNANIKVGQLITGTSINNFPNTYVAAISGTSLTLSQAASGSSTSTLSFFTPHGVVVGGGNNQATGSYSFIGGGGDAGTAGQRNIASGDWGSVVGGLSNIAAGNFSVVSGGQSNQVQSGATWSTVVGGSNCSIGTNSSAGVAGGNACSIPTNTFNAIALGGRQNTATGSYSAVIGGNRGTSRAILGNAVFSSCVFPIADAVGVSQSALLIIAKQTTDATATALTSDGNAAGSTNQVILPNNSAYFFRGQVISGVTGGGNTKGWTIEGVIKRGANAASTALVGTPTVTSSYADAGAATWAIAVTADTTNGGLRVTFTGQAATTIRTVCQIRTTEMTF